MNNTAKPAVSRALLFHSNCAGAKVAAESNDDFRHRTFYCGPASAEPCRIFVVQHRHLNHQRFTLAAIDDVIARGRWNDWAELREAVLADRALLDKVEQVCRPQVRDPYAQRHRFWMNYVRTHRTDA